MRSIPLLLVGSHISKNQYVQLLVVAHPSIHAGDRKQDGPGEEPYWQENFDHHTEKANEEIGVHAVRVDNVIVVRLEDRDWPVEDAF